MAEKFTEVRILDNFYQTSSFFPMPVLLVSTLAETGMTNLGAYSLCFPYSITGGTGHAMMLISRSTSNTAANILRTKVCALNFIPDKKKYMKNCVLLGYPGETTEEKMKNSIFTLLPSTRCNNPSDSKTPAAYPEIVEEAIQVFECTWDDSYPLKFNKDFDEFHFLLRIDKIIMKKKWYDSLLKGKGFPNLPIDYGYRNNVSFWFTKHSRPYPVPIPQNKGNAVDTVKYACERFDPDIKWAEESFEKLVNVPNIFLNKAIGGIVKEAKKEGLTLITPQFLDKVQDKRSSGK